MSSLIVEVSRITEVFPHPNADRLDIAKVKGWYCVVGRNEHKPGDLVIFVPPDSVLPPDMIERWNVNYLKNKTGRVGVIKLRGVYSYGLVLENKDYLPEGTDVTKVYDIRKWEPASSTASQGGKKKGRKYRGENHNFKKYTDIENIRNYPDVFEPGEEVVVTEKIHGTNFRAGWVAKELGPVTRTIRKWLNLGPAYEFVVGSRNVQLDPDEKTYYDHNVYMLEAKRLELEKKIPKGYVVYGEIFGAHQGKKIQDLTYGLHTLNTVFFDVMFGDRYLDYTDAVGFLVDIGLTTAPLLDIIEWEGADALDIYFEEPSMLDGCTMKEGVVIRPLKERIDYRLGRVVLKAINPEYLTRKGGTEDK